MKKMKVTTYKQQNDYTTKWCKSVTLTLGFGAVLSLKSGEFNSVTSSSL